MGINFNQSINSDFSKVPKLTVRFLYKNIARKLNEKNPVWTTSKILGLKTLRFSQPPDLVAHAGGHQLPRLEAVRNVEFLNQKFSELSKKDFFHF